MPMIPERLPRSASKGEERTFALFKKLPESYWIYYEAASDGRYPDFIVLAPDFGLLAVEVKAWYPKNLQMGDSYAFQYIEQNGQTETQSHLLRQARDYQWRIVEYLKQLPNVSALHFDGWAANLGVRREEGESSKHLGERLLEKLNRPGNNLYY